METPRTLIVAPDEHLRHYLAETLMPHIRGANVTLHEKSGLPHAYQSVEDHDEQRLDAAIENATHVLLATDGSKNDLSLLRRVHDKKECGVIVKSPDPSVYEQLAAFHARTPLRVVLTVGGPAHVEDVFAEITGSKDAVIPAFDLEHKPWLLMMAVFHKLWNGR